jgi:hypothetical protein
VIEMKDATSEMNTLNPSPTVLSWTRATAGLLASLVVVISILVAISA